MICDACGTANPETVADCVRCGRALGSFEPTAEVAGASAKKEPNLAGRTLADRYVVTRELGKGGMGVVYGATDLLVRQEIAIKVLQEQMAANHEELERFKRELTTSRSITHPNVIRIHDMGMLGRDLFISMELLTGGTLADRMRRGLLSIAEAREIGIGICEGLQAAHEQKVIHRDLKPHNVLFDASGRPKLVDFGLARLADVSSQTVGLTGTPSYISPEQADSGEVTPRSDIYSLGVVLFEMFTGRLPFLADNIVRLVMQHAKEKPPALRSIRAAVPPEVEAIVLRCLEKKPANRPASAAEVANLLRLLPADPRPVPPQTSKRSRVPSYFAGAAAFLLVVAIAAAFVLPSKEPIEIAATPASTPIATPTATLAVATPVRTSRPSPIRTAAVARTSTPAPTATPVKTVVAIATPAPRVVVGRLRVNADPECRGACWANVQVDGESRPSPCEVELTAGTHVVVIDRPGSAIRIERTLTLSNTGKMQMIDYRIVRLPDGMLKAIPFSG